LLDALVDTNLGTIACEKVVVAVGPRINAIWNMLELPKQISVRGRDGKMHDDVRMWRYMALQEGTLGVDMASFGRSRPEASDASRRTVSRCSTGFAKTSTSSQIQIMASR
jgi:hypothetical protein